MTRPESPGGPGSRRPTDEPAGPDPETVLAQALRAMAGGGKQGRSGQRPSGPPADPTPAAPTRLSILQIVLIAIILGLLLGMTVGLITLLV